MEATWAASSVFWYSGSSLPTIRFDQSNILWRSSSGTPNSSAITTRGSSAAMSVTKSARPCSMTLSMIRSVARWMLSWSSATIRGVNPLLTRRRYRVWSGGSMFSITSCCWARVSSVSSQMKVALLADEKCS